MIVHDSRLKGKTPLRYNYVMQIGSHSTIHHVISTVAHYGHLHRLSALHILCHGYEADWDLAGQVCTNQPHGGFGLQLAAEGLSLFNVGKTSSWKGLVETIVLFACAPADTGPGNAGTYGDGRRFVGELSLWSGARVVGARDTQYYNDASGKTTIDFGAWEGPVYQFTPDTPEGSPIADPSVYKLFG
jgi:hypothetical protein